jgi:hypothetical protein
MATVAKNRKRGDEFLFPSETTGPIGPKSLLPYNKNYL